MKLRQKFTRIDENSPKIYKRKAGESCNPNKGTAGEAGEEGMMRDKPRRRDRKRRREEG